MGVEVKCKWATDGEQHCYKAIAVNEHGRIVGKINVFADIVDYADLDEYLDGKAKEEIERSAESTLRTMVAARYGP